MPKSIVVDAVNEHLGITVAVTGMVCVLAAIAEVDAPKTVAIKVAKRIFFIM